MKSTTHRPFGHRVAALAVVLVVGACSSGQGTHVNTAPSPASAPTQGGGGGVTTLTDAERAAGWRLLFDGKTTSGWRGYKSDTISSAWQVVDGTLTKSKPADDLITREQFGDFELTLDWKLSPGGNSGVFYRGTEEYDHIYWSAPEYQLLDDAGHPDGRNPLTSAGSDYGLYPAPRGVVKPANEWNSTRIVMRGAHVEHWLNGQKLLEYELWSPDWESKVTASKFNAYPNYGRAKRGYIGLQGDHGGMLALRNIKIRELR